MFIGGLIKALFQLTFHNFYHIRYNGYILFFSVFENSTVIPKSITYFFTRETNVIQLTSSHI